VIATWNLQVAGDAFIEPPDSDRLLAPAEGEKVAPVQVGDESSRQSEMILAGPSASQHEDLGQKMSKISGIDRCARRDGGRAPAFAPIVYQLFRI